MKGRAVVLDRLRQIWDEQFDFLVRMNPVFDRLPLADRQRATNDYILHAQTELVELLNETQWKAWLCVQQREPDRDALVEEAVDVFKFVLNVMLTWDIDADKFFDAFCRKSEVNINRHLQVLQLSRIRALARRDVRQSFTAVLDLDGVLAAYPEHWLDYVCDKSSVRIAPEGFSLAFGAVGDTLSRERYSKLKHEYRAAGMEAKVPPRPGAVAFTQELRSLGYTIVIVSARPVDRYKRLYSDTVRWLKEHGVAYDAILWEPLNKEDKIIDELPDVEFVVEDDPGNVEKLHRAGIRTFLLDRPYNRNDDAGGAFRAADFGVILKMLTKNTGGEPSDE